MSRWAHEHPEQMEEIARLPLSAQSDALHDAMLDSLAAPAKVPVTEGCKCAERGYKGCTLYGVAVTDCKFHKLNATSPDADQRGS